ncbi:MAG TPA: SsrA-binding protein SmpB [Candidatus Cloacimonetes bacterium]|nr:SsrA-binding protein SmpB [Candidatus Cloacimonadota bacterium]
MRNFKNRKASHNYYFVEELETGIVLKGTEIKSIRSGRLNFKDSYAYFENDEIWLYNLHISQYEQGSFNNHDPDRKRKLLLHRKEIRKLMKKVEEKGFTLIPKEIYINEKGFVKVNLAVARGKRQYDKRETIQKKDEMRDMERKMKLNLG